jgi:hypothetical protein
MQIELDVDMELYGKLEAGAGLGLAIGGVDVMLRREEAVSNYALRCLRRGLDLELADTPPAEAKAPEPSPAAKPKVVRVRVGLEKLVTARSQYVKQITSVNRRAVGGYSFDGDFLRAVETDLPAGTLLGVFDKGDDTVCLVRISPTAKSGFEFISEWGGPTLDNREVWLDWKAHLPSTLDAVEVALGSRAPGPAPEQAEVEQAKAALDSLCEGVAARNESYPQAVAARNQAEAARSAADDSVIQARYRSPDNLPAAKAALDTAQKAEAAALKAVAEALGGYSEERRKELWGAHRTLAERRLAYLASPVEMRAKTDADKAKKAEAAEQAGREADAILADVLEVP